MSRHQINVYVCDICGVYGIPRHEVVLDVESGRAKETKRVIPPEGWLDGEPNNRHFCPSCRIAVEQIREGTKDHTQYTGQTIYAG